MEIWSMILAVPISIVGGALILALLWPYGAVIALFVTPFAASALLLGVSILVALQNSEQPIEPEAIQDHPNASFDEAK